LINYEATQVMIVYFGIVNFKTFIAVQQLQESQLLCGCWIGHQRNGRSYQSPLGSGAMCKPQRTSM